MKTLYYQSDIKDIVENCESYIEQCESQEERQAYQEELEKVKYDFYQLVESGIFHDACGEVINVFENWGQACAEVETEY
jgi:ribosomal protein S20